MNNDTETEEDLANPPAQAITTSSGIQRITKVSEPDAANRCQAVFGRGQCINEQVVGSQYCPMHGGNQGVAKIKRQEVNMYRLGKYQARLQELGSTDQTKNLRDEIGILRIMIEEFMNLIQVKTENMLLYSGRVADMISRLEKVIKTCHQIDLDTGKMLDKAQVMQFSLSLSDLIAKSIDVALKKVLNDSEIKLEKDAYSRIDEIFRHQMVDELINSIVNELATLNGSTNS